VGGVGGVGGIGRREAIFFLVAKIWVGGGEIDVD